jgi:hypothetical protein
MNRRPTVVIRRCRWRPVRTFTASHPLFILMSSYFIVTRIFIINTWWAELAQAVTCPTFILEVTLWIFWKLSWFSSVPPSKGRDSRAYFKLRHDWFLRFLSNSLFTNHPTISHYNLACQQHRHINNKQTQTLQWCVLCNGNMVRR